MEEIDFPTFSSEEQYDLENKVRPIFENLMKLNPKTRRRSLVLLRDNHVEYLRKGIRHLNQAHCSLDASRPWLCYWILHSLSLLGEPLDEGLSTDVIALLAKCQAPSGGYGGGPGQIPHLASTYAAVAALLTIGTEAAFSSIDRNAIHGFLVRMKLSSEAGYLEGGFKMSQVGEVDIRGAYAALAVAEMLDIKNTAVTFGVSTFLERCQTYEGGIGGEPGSEAHGGYTFCGLACHHLLGGHSAINLTNLTRWAVMRQGSAEGGFMGRTNKLVDGCYSFWQGGVFPLLSSLLPGSLEGGDLTSLTPSFPSPLISDPASTPPTPSPLAQSHLLHNAHIFGRIWPAKSAFGVGYESEEEWEEVTEQPGQHHQDTEVDDNVEAEPGGHVSSGPLPLFNSTSLQAWLLLCCQVLNGGLRDKPGTSRDYYHTCYCLSGLSVAQHNSGSDSPDVLGPSENLLERTNCVFNILHGKVEKAHAFFSGFTLECQS